MNDEERRIITAFVERISGVQPSGGGQGAGPWGGSVPSTAAAQPQRPPLPPIDPEADRLIAELFQRYPEARYRITQFAFVTEAALIQAQNRIQELEWELENARRQAEYAQASSQQARSGGGFLGGLFGGGGRPAAPPPPMPPRPQPLMPPAGAATPQMLQQSAMGPGRSGPGFLGTALTTAAGVAGGMVLGNALMSMFSGGHGGGAAQAASFAGGGGAFGQEQVPSSDVGAAASPWTDPGQAAAGLWGGQKSPYQDDAQPAAAGDWGQDDAQPAGYDYGEDDAGGYYDDAGGDEEF
ncbi:MAG: DUF2076 domain-containing protein [Acetobacteraceae bacterium]|nr:DUF2076 domain-containing protein [Acetobacteraceae bacterium]